MTQLDLNTLSPRIRAHKESLIHIVQPPVCTERARHYTEAYQAHLARPLPVRRALALAVPALVPHLGRGRFAVNGEFVEDGHELTEGDEVALIGLVGGG